jgi:hypothetical protein
MRSQFIVTSAVLALVLSAVGSGRAADVYGLEAGTPQLQSAGPLAFGPDGILLVGDTRAATVFAIATDDKSGAPNESQITIENVTEKIGGQLGVNPREVTINDMAVNPASGNVYLSATIEENQPALIRITSEGRISRLPLEDVRFSKATLADAPRDEVVQTGRRRQNPRDAVITDLAFVDGQVLVSGLSSSESPSSVRSLPFPFSEKTAAASLEIYHGAHGRREDYAPVRTFVPFVIDGEPNLLAGFTCTPLVKFPLSDVTGRSKVQGTTVAELGNRNTPIDIIVYQQDGKDYLLIANTDRGVMKVNAENVASQEPITERVERGETAGLPYDTIAELEGVKQLDKLNETHALVLVERGESLDLRTIPLP